MGAAIFVSDLTVVNNKHIFILLKVQMQLTCYCETMIIGHRVSRKLQVCH